MLPFYYENMMVVACSSEETGKVTRSMCKVGCIGCGLCAKQSDIFSVGDNLARVNYGKYQPTEQTKGAMEKCPTGVIVYRGKSALETRQPVSKPAVASK
jgi:ferredoxin